MLVSTMISNARLMADVPNSSFYTDAEALFAAQLAWEQIYAFLASNNDDYFCEQVYIPRTTVITGDITNGSPVITNVSTLMDVHTGVYITDTNGLLPDGAAVIELTSATSITLGEDATGDETGATLTLNNMMVDTNRDHVSGIWTGMIDEDSIFGYGLYRLRLIQYQGMGGQNTYYPVSKMTIENYGNTAQVPGYRFMNQDIAIYDPSNYQKYCVWYYPKPETLATTTDLSYPYNMIPEIMVYQIAAEIRRKQKADVTPWTSRVQELYASMSLQMSRDDSHGEPIKNQFAQGFAPYI